MSLILCLETATNICSVAIYQGDECLVELISTKERSHSEKLPELITTSLNKIDKTFDDISAVAVSKGPGSYTGLRIGVSIAKGIAYTLNLPLISVNTLKAMIVQGSEISLEDELLCPMIDARRLEVYCLVSDRKLQIIWETQALIVDESTFGSLTEERRILFFGDGSEKFSEMWNSNNNVRHISGILPKAKFIGRIAVNKFLNKQFEDVAKFEPYYLKNFQVGISKKIVPLL